MYLSDMEYMQAIVSIYSIKVMGGTYPLTASYLPSGVCEKHAAII